MHCTPHGASEWNRIIHYDPKHKQAVLRIKDFLVLFKDFIHRHVDTVLVGWTGDLKWYAWLPVC
jgi:hypothetical protein